MSSIHFSISYFSWCVDCRKLEIFFEIWWIIICIHVYPQLNFLFLKVGLCLFSFPHLQNFPLNCFSLNLFCFSYFYRGSCFFIGEVASIFYRVEFFCVSLILYFLLSFVVYVFFIPSDWIVFVNTWQKGREIDEIWKRFLTFFLEGDEIVFEIKEEKIKVFIFIFMYLT